MHDAILPSEAAPHVCTEIRMLRWSYDAVCLRETDDPLEQVCWLECCLLHCRNLIEFLDHRTKSDRIRAVDFTAGWRGNDHADLDKRINTYLTHIGDGRIEQTIWWVFNVVEPILADLRRFTEALEPATRELFLAIQPDIRPGAGCTKLEHITSVRASPESNS